MQPRALQHYCQLPLCRLVRTSLWMLACLMIFLLAGCSNTLETGYKPRVLGAGDNVRRGYYAQPFSPQAQDSGNTNISPYFAPNSNGQ